MATSIFREYFKGYEILGELGRGNARVLKARSTATGELVAIKHFAFNTEPDTLRRFQRESEIMKSIQHDYVVKILEVHLDAELPYIVMQLIEGGDLRSLLKMYGTLDLATVIRLAHHMTEALDAIHARAVVHRDVKPENIMYRRLPNGEIHFLLTDFGIAKLREQTEGITVTGASMLTYDYASPEQFNQSRMVAAATDYYSLGVVIYECLTGHVPFEYEQDDLLTHINRVISVPVPPPQLPNGKAAPPSLVKLLAGLLTKPCLVRLSNPVSVRHLLRQAAIEDLQETRPAMPASTNKTQVYQSGLAATATKKQDLTVAALILFMISVAVFFSWTTLVKSNAQVPAVSTTPVTETVREKKPVVTPTKNIPVIPKKKAVMPEMVSTVETAAMNDQETFSPDHDRQILGSISDPEPINPTTIPVRTAYGISLHQGTYFNDFSDPQDTIWDVGKDENSEYKLSNGKYVMKGLMESLSYSTAVKFNVNLDKDFAVSASAVHWGENSGDPYGINFCGDESQDSYFVFYVTSNGFYSIGAFIKDNWNVLVDWTPSSNIRPATELNTLSVEKQGNSLHFLINDRIEKILPFTGGFGNYFGMRIDGTQTVSFDRFMVKGSPYNQ